MPYLYAAFMSVPTFPFTPVKIGFTTNPSDRTKDYRHGPFPIEMIGFWEGTKEDEKNFHQEFKAERINGEWFIPTEELMDAIRGSMTTDDMVNSISTEDAEVLCKQFPRSAQEFLRA